MPNRPVQSTVFFLLLAALLFLAACTAAKTPAPTAGATELSVYADGIYRGYYTDGGIEQFCVEFTLANGFFSAVSLKEVNYKDGDYLAGDATRIQTQVAAQYNEAAQSLIGKPVSAVSQLLDPNAVTTDRDAVTSATLRTGKLASAIHDGLAHGVFRAVETTRLSLPLDAADGLYRGCSCGSEQIVARFSLTEGIFTQVTIVPPQGAALEPLCSALADYLTGKPVAALEGLYHPDTLPAECKGADGEQYGIVISALMDGFARGVFEPVETTVFPQLGDYENGLYRGFYYGDGMEQISIQFELVNDVFAQFRIRALRYGDGDYTAEDAAASQTAVYRQFLELTGSLEGKDVAARYGVYDPSAMVSDADGCSAATLPSNKLVSALMDALNRGVYNLED